MLGDETGWRVGIIDATANKTAAVEVEDDGHLSIKHRRTGMLNPHSHAGYLLFDRTRVSLRRALDVAVGA